MTNGDAQVHAPGVQVDAAGVPVPLGVESHRSPRGMRDTVTSRLPGVLGAASSWTDRGVA